MKIALIRPTVHQRRSRPNVRGQRGRQHADFRAPRPRFGLRPILAHLNALLAATEGAR